MDFTAGLMALEDALGQMLARITPLTDTETLPLHQAFGRVLARDVTSPLDVPGFDNSAMDGYAVRLGDVKDGAVLPVAGTPSTGATSSAVTAGGAAGVSGSSVAGASPVWPA